ncbi:MAG: RNA methyltransferase, partial [Pseudomonadota bacterium]
MLQHINVVLVEPTHPGNIGAVARAMKTMGINRLRMVKPKKFPHYEATKRAAGADDVLERATLYDDLSDAIADSSLVIGTSVRDREVAWPTYDAKETVERVHNHFDSLADLSKNNVSLVFGRESSGLTNVELDRCDFQVRIPSDADYGSLNLASAVQIICYELRCRLFTSVDSAAMQPATEAQKRHLPLPPRTEPNCCGTNPCSSDSRDGLAACCSLGC